MGQQAPLTPTGAGQAAGGQASTKQVICPSCRRDGARTLSPWPATARPSLPGWLLGQAVTGAYSRVPSEPRPLPPTPRRPGDRGPSHSSTLGPRWRPLALTERRLDQSAAARARPVLRPPHPGGTCPAPGCRDGARAGPPPPGAGRRPHSRGTRSGCRRPAATRRRRGACARLRPCTRPCRAATPVSGSTKPNAHGHSWWPACHPAHSPAGQGEDAGAETDGCAELRWSRRRGTVRRPLTASARRRAEPPEGGTAVPAASPQRQDSARLAARGGGAGSRRPEHLAAPPTSLPSAERKGHATSIPPPPGSRPRNGASANGSVWSRR